MPVGKLILFGILGLVVAEATVFLTVAWMFGSFAAVAGLIATSLLGMLVLAQMGRRLAGRLVDILSQRDFGAPGTRSGGFLTTLGGLLLVLPGFITDCVGLLLLIPAVQRRLIARAPTGRPRPDASRVLDLDRSQWRDLPDRHIADGAGERRRVPPRRSRRR
ncbi:MAG: FxsA family protein [Pseudorhodoplanes sp.]|uniref:FxsA family protein n=1 Tax=Pseudorhodoplanes sp. TaxID=1934341 RepID=UPI003D1214B4